MRTGEVKSLWDIATDIELNDIVKEVLEYGKDF